MTHDEVRQKLRDLALEFAPQLARAVLDHRDFEFQRELATRVDAAVQLLAEFEREVTERPGADSMTVLVSLAAKLDEAKSKIPEERKGPSIWDLIRSPSL